MAIRIESPAEAFAAVASVVIAADSMGSMDERNAVLQRLKEAPALKGQDTAALTALLAKVTGHLCDGLPTTETGAFTPAAVDQVIAAVKGVLGAEQRAQALKLAEATMDSDGANDSEKALLAQLRAGLK
jgi:tellurite resistance protein